MPTTPSQRDDRKTVEGSGHTPGPWTVFPREGAVEGFTVETTPEQLPVAIVPKNRRSNKVAEANARLIATAPNMLTLLKAMVAKHQAPETSEDIAEFDELMCAAQLLIAKAEIA